MSLVKHLHLRFICATLFCFFIYPIFAQHGQFSTIQGTVKNSKGEPVEFATVFIKNTQSSTQSDQKGNFSFQVRPGLQTLVVQLISYNTYEKQLNIKPNDRLVLHVTLEEKRNDLDEVVVEAKSAVQRINESAYNVVAIDAKALHNSTLDLAHAMARISGVKIRESGGLGSNLQFSLNGFTGRHVKFFMDGVPMDGMGSSFQINNIPINMAERIEIYKGVVPVGFGADALGGVVNIVTNQRKRTYIDVSYSYGSFNTHRTTLSAGYTTQSGLMFEINAFQNYSDNSYWINNRVKEFGEDGSISFTSEERIKRFHDGYHNETLIGKIGFVNKSFADRLMLTLNVGKTYNEIQTAVSQDVVFGKKHNKAKTFMPSFVYSKRNLLTEGLDVNLTANFNKNIRQNIDTATYIYNWRGESKPQSSKGEQSYQDSEYENRSWNATFNAGYKIDDKQSIALNNVFTSFDRNTRSTGILETTVSATDTMPKISRKNVSGLSYKFNYYNKWNVSVFAKHFLQYVKGPQLVQVDKSHTKYELFSKNISQFGYGAAGTYFFKDFQFKLSYEKAYRLPTDTEMFGDEDMEQGSTDLKPENSDNYNLNITYSKDFDKVHFFMLDLGFMYRDTKDFIHRIVSESGSVPVAAKSKASYINYGSIRNRGFNGEARYTYKNFIMSGINLTYQDLRDNEINRSTNEKSSLYGVRIPNIPYFFVNGDLNVNWNNAIKKGNVMSFAYYVNYVHEFTLFAENQGYSDTKKRVPTQFSHDVSLTYVIKNGRYNISLECKNLTDEKLYDNYSLQKPSRAFYAKVRYFFSK